jgi:hypothetical protein
MPESLVVSGASTAGSGGSRARSASCADSRDGKGCGYQLLCGLNNGPTVVGAMSASARHVMQSDKGGGGAMWVTAEGGCVRSQRSLTLMRPRCVNVYGKVTAWCSSLDAAMRCGAARPAQIVMVDSVLLRWLWSYRAMQHEWRLGKWWCYGGAVRCTSMM